MLVRFENEDLELIYINGAEEGKPKYGKEIIRSLIKKVDIIAALSSTTQLLQMRSLNFEALKGDYKGYHSVRLNDQYRLILKVVKEADGEITIEVVEIHDLVDYH